MRKVVTRPLTEVAGVNEESGTAEVGTCRRRGGVDAPGVLGGRVDAGGRDRTGTAQEGFPLLQTYESGVQMTTSDTTDMEDLDTLRVGE